MSSKEWKKVKLSEIAYLNYGKSLTSDIRKEGKIPVYSSSGITGWHDTALVIEDGIVIGRKGNVGSIFYADGPFYCIDTAYYIKKSELKCNIKYFYYLLKTLGLDKLNEDSAVPGLSRDTAHSQLFSYPEEIDTQRRIADILSALDDKIELNRQTNATLEAIAQAIFKEWFINFNFPGGTGEMVESELGMIPKGWRVDSILMVAELLSGGTPSTKINEYWSGDIKWISAKDVSNAQGSFVLDTERKITRLGVKNSSTKILPKLTTIVTARGTVGSYCILSEPMAMNQTNYGLKAKEQESDYFVFFSLANLVAQLQQASYGTIFDTVTTITFEKSKIIIPPYFIIQKFDQLLRPLMGTILGNLEQSDTLSKIRDSILPKLMNGEINV